MKKLLLIVACVIFMMATATVRAQGTTTVAALLIDTNAVTQDSIPVSGVKVSGPSTGTFYVTEEVRALNASVWERSDTFAFPGITTSPFTVWKTGLTPGTTYWVRLRSWSGADTVGFPTDSQAVATKLAPQAPTITVLDTVPGLTHSWVRFTYTSVSAQARAFGRYRTTGAVATDTVVLAATSGVAGMDSVLITHVPGAQIPSGFMVIESLNPSLGAVVSPNYWGTFTAPSYTYSHLTALTGSLQLQDSVRITAQVSLGTSPAITKVRFSLYDTAGALVSASSAMTVGATGPVSYGFGHLGPDSRFTARVVLTQTAGGDADSLPVATLAVLPPTVAVIGWLTTTTASGYTLAIAIKSNGSWQGSEVVSAEAVDQAGSHDTTLSVADTDTVYLTVSGRSPNTAYAGQVTVMNGAGLSATTTYSVLTDTVEVDGPPSFQYAVNNNPSEVTLHGIVLHIKPGHTSRIVGVITDNTFGTVDTVLIAAIATSATATLPDFVYDSLYASHAYCFSILDLMGGGTVIPGNTECLTTQPSVPCIMHDIVVDSVTSNQITVTVEATGGGEPSQLTVRLYDQNSFQVGMDFSVSTWTGSVWMPFTWPNLSPATTYTVWAEEARLNGSFPATKFINARTLGTTGVDDAPAAAQGSLSFDSPVQVFDLLGRRMLNGVWSEVQHSTDLHGVFVVVPIDAYGNKIGSAFKKVFP